MPVRLGVTLLVAVLPFALAACGGDDDDSGGVDGGGNATDNGTPNLSATNSFTITVNPLTPPTITAPTSSGGQFSLTVTGQTGPDYAVQVSTDLLSGVWVTLFTTNSPSMPFSFVDTNGTAPAQFYRIIVGPPLP